MVAEAFIVLSVPEVKRFNNIHAQLIGQDTVYLAISREFAPLESDVRNQNGHECNNNDLPSEAGLAVTIPGRNGLQDASANEGKGYGVGAYHPFTMLLKVPIGRSKESSSCDEKPRSRLNNICGNEVDGTWVVAGV
jgi:hypothetical protein